MNIVCFVDVPGLTRPDIMRLAFFRAEMKTIFLYLTVS